MPRRDGTGPMGLGSMTGRGLGNCEGSKEEATLGMGYGFGRACRRGMGRGAGRGMLINQNPSKTQKEWLEEQKEFLEKRLEVIDKELKDL